MPRRALKTSKERYRRITIEQDAFELLFDICELLGKNIKRCVESIIYELYAMLEEEGKKVMEEMGKKVSSTLSRRT